MQSCNEMASWSAKKSANNLSEADRNKLAVSVVNLAKKIVRESLASQGANIDREDAEGEAFLACVESAKYYDPDSGIAFSTYAAAWIRRSLSGWLAAQAAQLARGMECPEVIVDKNSEGEEVVIPGDVEVEIDAKQMLLLKQLAGIDRDIAILVVFAGHSPERVAVRLGIDVKDVKLRMRNIAGQLAGFMMTYCDDAESSMFATHTHEE